MSPVNASPNNQEESTPTANDDKLPSWLVVVLSLAVLAVVSGSTFWIYAQAKAFAANNDVTSIGSPQLTQRDESAEFDPSTSSALPPPGISTTDREAPALLSPSTFQPWQGTDRVNILLLGVDQRCLEEGPTRTDTMIILSIDPLEMTVSTLSLPRDTWTDIPGFGIDRINQAHYFGEIYQYPGGGPALAMETVENFLGLTIDHYATVNFAAFVEMIDALGGLNIYVPETIDDPYYPDDCYGFEGFHIAQGEYTMDGETALKYARTRETDGGDIDRANRQQAVILALRNDVLQVDRLPNLIAKSPQLWLSLQNNVRTSLTDTDVIQLALLLEQIDRDSYQTGVLDYNYVFSATTLDGRSVLIPIRDEVRNLRAQLFGVPQVPLPVYDDFADGVLSEAARVAVLNGTSTFGLAGQTESWLREKGLEITEVGNADSSTYSSIVIYDYGNNPDTVHYISQIMGVRPLNARTGEGPKPEGDTGADYDVLVIIGADWQIPN